MTMNKRTNPKFNLNDKVYNTDLGIGTVIEIDYPHAFNPYRVHFDSFDMSCWCKEENIKPMSDDITLPIGYKSRRVILQTLKELQKLQDTLIQHSTCEYCVHDKDNALSECIHCPVGLNVRFKCKENGIDWRG